MSSRDKLVRSVDTYGTVRIHKSARSASRYHRLSSSTVNKAFRKSSDDHVVSCGILFERVDPELVRTKKLPVKRTTCSGSKRRRTCSKPILSVDAHGKVQKFKSISDAALFHGMCNTTIGVKLRKSPGERVVVKGISFEYLKPESTEHKVLVIDETEE